jgi:pre-mRNA-splicing factor CWC26
MSMQAYLAQKYMSGPKADAILARAAPKKKKKRKAEASASASASGSAMIVDADAGWGEDRKDEGADDLEEAVVEKDRGFKKRRVEESSNWETIQPGIKDESPPADEQPVVVEEQSSTPFVGGLLTSEQLRNTFPQSRGKMTELTREEIEAAQETVYRDAQGHIIDTKAAKAEAARKKREREEREAQKMEWGKGLVQREEQDKRKLELEKQKTRGFARYADDKDLNEDMRAQERWNDPAAAFLTVSRRSLSSTGCVINILSCCRKKQPRARVSRNILVHYLRQIALVSNQVIDGTVLVCPPSDFYVVYDLYVTFFRPWKRL